MTRTNNEPSHVQNLALRLATENQNGTVFAPDRTIAAMMRRGWVCDPHYTYGRNRRGGRATITDEGRAVVRR